GYYSCRVANDATGNYFVSEMRDAGITTNPQDPTTDSGSGRCLILVSPDAERSLNTCLGISEQLTVSEIDEASLIRSNYLFIEGYLASSTSGAAAAARAREIADENDVSTSLTLSDPNMVIFFREALNDILGNGIFQLFCNEEEALTWAKTDRLDIAARELADIASNVAITMGPNGSLCVGPDGKQSIAGHTVKAIDTNGAGDMYAGAFLAAISQRASPFEAARFANFAAANVVTRYGARLPSIDAYKELKLTFDS
ncbi:MAG: adenosine kinase, partial [Pseudomonadota bacterium]|nr:adenosine kinase [Pseudomonadota bacterium]